MRRFDYLKDAGAGAFENAMNMLIDYLGELLIAEAPHRTAGLGLGAWWLGGLGATVAWWLGGRWRWD
jgi:hypothetical protein